ncbi:MAG: hypothetical protein SO176_04585 [Bacilli bacterium]|nr:hypothetical protein [Bacilli bacterium]
MKKINDQPILKIIKDHQNYQITTTSENILAAKDNHPVIIKKKNHKLSLILSLSSLALSCAVIIVGINMIFNNQKHQNDIYLPNKNKVISKQLLTFNAFNHLSSSIKGRLLKSNEGISENIFQHIVDNYEYVEEGIRNLFVIDQYSSVTVNTDFIYSDKAYTYETRLLDPNHHVYARIYYNDINNNQLDALYVYNEQYYQALITTKNKKDEEEVTTILSSLDEKDTYTYVIEKEKEYQGVKVENSYSYTTYSSLEDYRNDEDSYINKIEYELEDNDIDITYENTTNNEEIEFTNIIKFDTSHYQFTVDEYEYQEEEIEDILIDLYYLEDNSRKYIYSDYQIIKK